MLLPCLSMTLCSRSRLSEGHERSLNAHVLFWPTTNYWFGKRGLIFKEGMSSLCHVFFPFCPYLHFILAFTTLWVNAKQQGQSVGSLEGFVARSTKREVDPTSFCFPLFFIYSPGLARDKKEKLMSALSKEKHFQKDLRAPFVWANTIF